MARPKLGEGETQRLHVKISDEELTAIDDWRFANRIASRSEAVRRLVQIALVIEQNMDELQEVLRINGDAEKEYGDAFAQWLPHKLRSDLDIKNPIERRFVEAMLNSSISRSAQLLTISSIVRPINVLRGASEVSDEILNDAKEANQFFREQAKRFTQIKLEKDE